MTHPLPEPLLDRAEAARRLGISERLLWRLTAKGAVPSIRLGRTVRYCPKAIASVIEKGGAK
jgi:excisionase family DNA binding protein